MSLRSLTWQIPLTLFQRFDGGEIVESLVPIAWNLQIGDRLMYEAGSNISGMAEVVVVGKTNRDDIRCTFKKVY